MLFTIPALTAQELDVLGRIDELRRSLGYASNQPRRWTGMLRRMAFAKAIRGSNSIEGYNVSVEDAIAAAEGEEPLDADAATWRAVTGYRNAMTYVLQLADDPHFTFSDGLLRSLHFMMIHYDLTKNPGKWRPGSIYVRNDERGEVVYEGPEAEKVPALMGELVSWLNHGDLDAHVIVRGAMSHLNLVMIHPFADGNGRMGRCLQTLVLARQGILAPQFSSVEEYLGRNQQEYYDVLGEVGAGRWHPERDGRPWLRFILTAHFRQAMTFLRRIRETQKVWEALEVEVARRGLPERAIYALYDAAFGFKVRNATYRPTADIPENLASRDLKLLVDRGLLTPRGERRGRYYLASEAVKTIRARASEPKSTEDPFVDAAA